jgi:hypothetical protein
MMPGFFRAKGLVLNMAHISAIEDTSSEGRPACRVWLLSGKDFVLEGQDAVAPRGYEASAPVG